MALVSREALRTHEWWWDAIFANRVAAGAQVLTLTPEYAGSQRRVAPHLETPLFLPAI